MRAALGEVAHTSAQMDDLFVRHTYLSMVIGMVVQASFRLDIRSIAEQEPSDLLRGGSFRSATGLQGVIESDFFAWPTEVGGGPLIRALARRIARFDWKQPPSDIASILYETVIPADERRTLGEYYTPRWLARTMVGELIEDPLEQTVLDPACGSGTFVAEAVDHFIRASESAGLEPKETLDRLANVVAGIDVHPVAVHLARSAWVLAARPAIQAATDAGYDASVTVPIYLGDALHLRFRGGDMFAEYNVTIQVGDDQNTELVFPVSLVERPNDFDSLMEHVADAIERGEEPRYALDDNGITDPVERKTLEETIATLQSLHNEGRDHIWAYYTRNPVRPVALARSKVDVIVGNPPWLNYNHTANTLRSELRHQSSDVYGKSGRPTAAIVEDSECVVDHLLYWVNCGGVDEAEYLLAIINSDTLYESAQSVMSKGQFGARDLYKHLWKLPIPEFDVKDALHMRLAEAGRAAGKGAALRLEQLREERERVTVTIARREIRKWLAGSEEGREVEEAVSELLRG